SIGRRGPDPMALAATRDYVGRAMKPTTTAALLLLTLPFATHLSGQSSRDDRSHPDGPVSVEFQDMDNYTDFGTSFQSTEQSRKALAEQLREEINRIAPRYVPDGMHLDLTFLDINQAGEFEPQ